MPSGPHRIKRLPVRLSRLAGFFCLSVAARAQFTNLTSTDDGSALYFLSGFRLASYDGPQQSFFIWDAQGFRPIPQSGQSLDVNGDGSVVSYTNTTTVLQFQPPGCVP